MPGWLRNSLVVAVVIGGALLLWVGFALLVAALLIVAIPFSIWSIFARRRVARGPVTVDGSVTVEGSAKRVDETVVLAPPYDDKTRTGSGPRVP